jgi:hypothetical protein
MHFWKKALVGSTDNFQYKKHFSSGSGLIIGLAANLGYVAYFAESYS